MQNFIFTVDEIVRLISLCYKTKRNGSTGKITPMIWGWSGYAKTAATRLASKIIGGEIREVQLGSSDNMGDLLGLPIIKETKFGKVTEYAPPSWWPLDPKSKGIIFLDEVNRVNSLIKGMLVEFLLTYKIGGRPLPEGWLIVAAGNFPEQFDVTDLDDAVMNRLLHVVVNCDIDHFAPYFGKVDPAINKAIEAMKRFGDGVIRTDSGERFVFTADVPVNPRAIEHAHRFITETKIEDHDFAKKCVYGLLRNKRATEVLVGHILRITSKLLKDVADKNSLYPVLQAFKENPDATIWAEVLEDLKTRKPSNMSLDVTKRLATFIGTINAELMRVAQAFISTDCVRSRKSRKRLRKSRNN